VVNRVPFEIEESGWGEFEIQITIFFVDPNEKPVFAFIVTRIFQRFIIGHNLSSFKIIFN
jgi:YEATS domain-containing protein 4